MTVFRRSIRNMMDASLDLTGTEKIRSSDNTGWTTQVGNYFINQGNQSLAFTAYDSFGDASTTVDPTTGQLVPDPQFPHQDGVTRNTSNNTLTLSGVTNVGLKHYFHQLQAMRGSNDFASGGTGGGSSGNAMGEPGAGASVLFPGLGFFPFNPSLPTPFTFQGRTFTGVPAVGPFSGTSNLYQSALISMGNMKGFKYHTANNSIWDASSGANAIAEELRSIGMVRIGKPV